MSLLNCAPSTPSRLRSLPIINTRVTYLRALPITDTRLTHLRVWTPYPSLIRVCMLLPSSISALHTFASSCYKYHCVCRPLSKNSLIWSKLSVLDQKNPFWTSLTQKMKIVGLSWNLVPKQFEYGEFNDSMVMFTFSLLDQKYPFWVNLSKKSKFSVWVEIWYLC